MARRSGRRLAGSSLAAVVALAALAFAAPAPTSSSSSASGPGSGATSAPAGGSGTSAPARYGSSERTELGGGWLFRLTGTGPPGEGLQRSTSTTGWTPVSVPNAWNAHDTSAAGMEGTVAWYRKDFQLPSADAASTWLVRFESVNNRVQAWLNGQPIGSHAGAALPFQLELPARLLDRNGTNHLVLRVDDRRDPGRTALWWNYGGILRRVYLQRVEQVGFGAVQVLPRLRCPTCAASIEYRVQLHNYSAAAQAIHLGSRYGTLPVDLGTATIAPGATATYTGAAQLQAPRLWSPSHPYLYEVTLDADRVPPPGATAHAPPLAHYWLRSGVRSVAVSHQGTVLLNGAQVSLRGVGLVEDSPQTGAALSETAERRLITEARETGATLIRTQYPLDEYMEELADEAGIMLWSEIPFDKLPPREVARGSVRSTGLSELRENILTNSSHPSVIVWSIANELWPRPDASQGEYIARAAALAHQLDPTRPVGLAVAAYPSVGCQARWYAPLDVIGLNDYFGWYPGPVGDLRSRSALPAYLDAIRNCYRGKGLFITEFGVEANRAGPAGERGTYSFQDAWVRYQLQAFASRPWLAGAIYWALKEFRVRPGWNGGNPKPTPPLHTKGLISFSGARKPAFYIVQTSYRATTQVNSP